MFILPLPCVLCPIKPFFRILSVIDLITIKNMFLKEQYLPRIVNRKLRFLPEVCPPDRYFFKWNMLHRLGGQNWILS